MADLHDDKEKFKEAVEFAAPVLGLRRGTGISGYGFRRG